MSLPEDAYSAAHRSAERGHGRPSPPPTVVARVVALVVVALVATGLFAPAEAAKPTRTPTPAKKEAELRKLKDRI